MDGKIHSDADVNALTDGTKIIFGDDSDKDGEYPYGTFKATGDAKAASDAEAYAPFRTDMNFGGPSENPHCLDESGSSRVYGETWYKNGDACNLCCCHSYACVCNPSKCITFDEDFICPTGQTKKLVSSDGCCQIPKCTYVSGSQDIEGKSMATTNLLQSSPILMSFNDVDKLSKPYENSVNGITGSHSSA